MFVHLEVMFVLSLPAGRSDSVTPDLNFPLPDETGPACIMKVGSSHNVPQ